MLFFLLFIGRSIPAKKHRGNLLSGLISFLSLISLFVFVGLINSSTVLGSYTDRGTPSLFELYTDRLTPFAVLYTDRGTSPATIALPEPKKAGDRPNLAPWK